ncbi:hypothetical protein, partial [Eisenbergiella tayi]|uniref:hypothetical protein n=1 Tax=Eisenbergiella tayi TaxID=1432052 RepID=UPI00242E6F34
GLWRGLRSPVYGGVPGPEGNISATDPFCVMEMSPTRQDLRLRYFPPGPERRRTLGSEDRDTGRQTADGSS